jgi:hypothetical protein
MRAIMTMEVEPLFGGQVELRVEAEIDNAHMLSNRALFTDMASMLRHMVDEVRSESEQILVRDAGLRGREEERETAGHRGDGS